MKKKAIFSCVFYFSSFIGKVLCLREKRAKTASDALKKVTSKGRDVCSSDGQIHQNNERGLSIILL